MVALRIICKLRSGVTPIPRFYPAAAKGAISLRRAFGASQKRVANPLTAVCVSCVSQVMLPRDLANASSFSCRAADIGLNTCAMPYSGARILQGRHPEWDAPRENPLYTVTLSVGRLLGSSSVDPLTADLENLLAHTLYCVYHAS